MSVDIMRITYEDVKGEYYRNMAEEFLDMFGFDNNDNIFYLPERKEVVERINKEVEEDELRNDMLKFVELNKENTDYLVSW